MNQYTAPMPGHFMWHLFSIPLLGTKSWPGAAALWPISLSQGWGMQSASGFISFELTAAWLNMPLSFPRSLDAYLSERVQNKEEKKLFATALQENCNVLYSEHGALWYHFSCPLLPTLHFLCCSDPWPFFFSTVYLLACFSPLFSRDYLSPVSFVSLSLFLIPSYCRTTGISLSH